MKKIIGSKIFTFILGGIFFSAISVIATKAYDASQIQYGNTTVDQALNTLYTSASASNYTPSGHVTPSTSAQTLETENKRVTSNIVIDPIPSNYKNISSSTLSKTKELAPGVIAYKSDGTQVTGDGCIRGSFVCDDDCVGSKGKKLISFNPSFFVFYGNTTAYWYNLYNSVDDSNIEYDFNGNSTFSRTSLRTNVYYFNNGLYVKNWGENSRNYTVYFVACK